MKNLCACGCGKEVVKSKRGYIRKYASGHEGMGRILNYINLKIKKCNKCKEEKNIQEFSFRNYLAPNGSVYQRPRSRCKKCECSSAYDAWRTSPEVRKRRRENKRKDRSVKSLIQNRIAAWRKKTNNSNLTTEYLLNLYNSQNGRCYYTDEPLEMLKIFEWKEKYEQSISLDRLDPEKGYMQGNVVFCLYAVNTMKGKLKEEQFYEKLKSILRNKNQLR